MRGMIYGPKRLAWSAHHVESSLRPSSHEGLTTTESSACLGGGMSLFCRKGINPRKVCKCNLALLVSQMSLNTKITLHIK